MIRAFWDSSSLVPLCVVEASSANAHVLASRYSQVVWWATPVEMCSSFARLVRMRQISSNGQVMALVKMDKLQETWSQIDPADAVRDRARIFVDRFGLIAADAMQLAAAWAWCSGHPGNRPLVSGDTQLLDAAADLGFNAIGT